MEVKVTPLALSVLELLHEQSMHPYEMHRTIRLRQMDRVVKVNAGSLYHTVERLARAEFVEAFETERAGRRPERTMYRITPAGRQLYENKLREMLSTLAEEYPNFPLALALGDDLATEDVIGALRQRKASLEGRIDSEAGELERSRNIGLPERYSLDRRYVLAMHRSELQFVSELLDDLESGRLGWQLEDGNDVTPEAVTRER